MSKELLNNIRQNGFEYYGIYLGCYRATVYDNKDPEKLGRLRIKCEQVLGPDIISDWAWPKGVPAGNNAGLWLIPSVGDNVWISFEAGRQSSPIWEYGWWSQGQNPETDLILQPKTYLIKTPGGHSIQLNDTTNFISLEVDGGLSIKLGANTIIKGGNTGLLHPEVLGLELVKILTELISYVSTAVAGGYPLSTAADIAAVTAKLTTLLSKQSFNRE